MTGLIIGSMTPDFEYFLRMKIQSNYSHTISGLFWFNLPLGILLAFIFHNIVRDSLFDNLPNILKSRLLKFKHFDWNGYFKKNWLVVVISILIGADSHILWDSFTHEKGYFVRTIPAMTSTINILDREIPTFKVLQHSSTLLGGLVIAIALLKLTSDDRESVGLSAKYWGVLSLFVMIIIVVRILTGLDYRLYGHLIVTAISAGLLSLILTPIFLKQIK